MSELNDENSRKPEEKQNDDKDREGSDNSNGNTTAKTLDKNAAQKILSVIPKKKQQSLKWNGWGWKDSSFQLINREVIVFTGNRYPIGGGVRLPLFKDWVEEKFKVDLTDKRASQGMPSSFPDSIQVPEFMKGIQEHKIDHSEFGEDRLVRCHGQSLHDIHTLREGKFARIPDLVLWPICHDEVVQIVKLATEYNVVLIPFGGGTSVSGAVTCPENETRSIAVLDTTQMNKMLWLDRENLIACFEAGIIGQDLERELQKIGLTVGHEPDSYEFSTLGGWVATRASGMKKNVYGNIEDIVVRVKMMTSCGVFEKNVTAPRVSCGPDFSHIIMGSEGTFGVVTEVVIKVRPLPTVRRYGSIAFPNLESGIKCLREIAKRRCQPASIRLMDTEQFEFGHVLKPAGAWYSGALEVLKKGYLTKIKGFDLNKMAAATLLFEGEEEDIKRQEKLIYDIAAQHGGFSAGATNGMKGYILTFVIAYIRDLALEYSIVAESFETSMPWDRCEALCRNVKIRVGKECKKHNVDYYMISCRVTQTYDAGACVYFYFGFNHSGLENPVETYEQIENCARDEILASGGSISHHHGIGKIRSKWYRETVSDIGVDLYKATKRELDPKNIFAVGNLLHDPTTDGHAFKSKL